MSIKQRKKYHIIGKDFGLLTTLVVYSMICRISFVKVQITKIMQSLTKLFYVCYFLPVFVF